MSRTSAKKLESYSFRILGVKTNSVKLEDEPEYQIGDSFNYSIQTSHLVSQPTKQVKVFVHFSVSEGDKKDLMLIELQTECTFEVEDIDKITPSGHDLPDELRYVLHGVTISTTRGIFYMCVRGTYLQKAVLPVVDPTKMSPVQLDETRPT
jgi:hypothetical protein